MLKKLVRPVVHLIADSRRFYYGKIGQLAKNVRRKKILELGSGPLVKGSYYYSVKHLFDSSNTFIQSDVVPDFGHPIIDVTTMRKRSEYDYIICLNVLEHVFDFTAAIKNMHAALKKGGRVVIAVPAMYPLHDEPHDYWRFTEHSLRKLLGDFKEVKVLHTGRREFPFGYYVEARK